MKEQNVTLKTLEQLVGRFEMLHQQDLPGRVNQLGF
jgi:hypothetical protein